MEALVAGFRVILAGKGLEPGGLNARRKLAVLELKYGKIMIPAD